VTKFPSESKSVPKGKLKRGAVVGSAVVKVGAKKAVHLGTRPFLSDDARIEADKKSDEDAARIIFNALSVLRGCALKAAQLVADEAEILPPAYRRELQKACSKVPPMNRALVLKILTRELGPLNQAFESFELIPFAAASLGQVHAAKLQGGIDVAVKIQYPGIADGVKSDIELLKGVLTPTRFRRIFEHCFPAISSKMEEELDYRQEAQHAAFFGEHLPVDRFVVPTIDKERSTTHVLTSTRIVGLHLLEWLKTSPSQSERDHAGQRLADLLQYSIHSLGVVHADPNPGNFLFRDDGRLGIVDFGCVERLTPAMIDTASALMNPDRPIGDVIEQQLTGAMGIHYRKESNIDELKTFLTGWMEWLREPYRKDGYDFSEHEDYFQRGLTFVGTFYQHIHHYRGDFIYFGRTIHGLMRMLSLLGAKVRMANGKV
jgi:predicted unusual protein kinase regulating ubiquinone biosynthesis (AarF/ABC1/UbiB family)